MLGGRSQSRPVNIRRHKDRQVGAALGAAACALLPIITPEPKSGFVFPAVRGEGHYQGTKRVWRKAVERAALIGITPRSLRHTMGSTAVSTGEALAMTGAILGHANARSTSIYAHVQRDPAKRAADRVSKRIAAALGERPSRNPPPSPSKSRDAAWSRATQASQGGARHGNTS